MAWRHWPLRRAAQSLRSGGPGDPLPPAAAPAVLTDQTRARTHAVAQTRPHLALGRHYGAATACPTDSSTLGIGGMAKDFCFTTPKQHGGTGYRFTDPTARAGAAIDTAAGGGTGSFCFGSPPSSPAAPARRTSGMSNRVLCAWSPGLDARPSVAGNTEGKGRRKARRQKEGRHAHRHAIMLAGGCGERSATTKEREKARNSQEAEEKRAAAAKREAETKAKTEERSGRRLAREKSRREAEAHALPGAAYHMPCVSHGAACRAAVQGQGMCAVLHKGLLDLFHGNADVLTLMSAEIQCVAVKVRGQDGNIFHCVIGMKTPLK